MENMLVEANATTYKSNPNNNNSLYIFNNKMNGIGAEIKTLEDGFKHLGFTKKQYGKRVLTQAQDFTEVISYGDFSNIDYIALVVLTKEGALPDADLKYLEAFFSNKNPEMERKPRIFIFLYEFLKKAADNVNNDVDSALIYSLPIQADLLLLQLVVADVGKAAQQIGTRFKNINKDSYFDNEIIEILQHIEDSKLTISSTLTRRLYMSPKEVKRIKKNFKIDKLKLLISYVEEMDDDAKKVELFEKYNLYDVSMEIEKNINPVITDLDKMIKELEVYFN